jgi:hypothetical protein
MPKFKVRAQNSIRDRVLSQSDIWSADGGTFGMSRNAFGGTVTTCSGGSQGDWTCTNTNKHTSCGPASIPPPPDEGGAVPATDEAPPAQGDDPATGGAGAAPRMAALVTAVA